MDKKGVWLFGFLLFGVVLFYFDKLIIKSFTSISYLFNFFMFFGRFELLLSLMVLIFVFLLVRDRKRIYLYIFLLASSYIISLLVKILVMRPRPLDYLDVEAANLIVSSSFPSSHAFILLALLPLVLLYSRKIGYVYFIITIPIMLSRVYFGLHYPTDIFFGAFIGYLYGKSIINFENRKKIFQKVYYDHIKILKSPFVK